MDARRLATAICEAVRGTDVVVAYTDIVRVPLDPTGPRGGGWWMMEAHAEVLMDACRNKTLLVPAYNYDFFRTLSYDSSEASAKAVGALNESMRLYARRRTPGPLFNFSVMSVRPPYEPPRVMVEDPFGRGSTLRWLIDMDAAVLAYGAELRHCSALHVNEADANVPYRYYKVFEGEADGAPCRQRVHVRHPEVSYRWEQVNAILEPVFYPVTGSCESVRVSSARKVYGALADALANDEHAFVDPPLELYERYGKPLSPASDPWAG